MSILRTVCMDAFGGLNSKLHFVFPGGRITFLFTQKKILKNGISAKTPVIISSHTAL